MLPVIGKRLATSALLLLPALTFPGTASATIAPLPLGPPGLTENRLIVQVVPGVTLTTITRGEVGADAFWTISAPILPNGSLVASLESAQAVQQTLSEQNISSRIEAVASPQFADFAATTLGYRVRVGRYSSSAAAFPDWAVVFAALGSKNWPSIQNTSEDGENTTGPWAVRILTIDPKHFKGALTAAHGANLATLTKTSQIAAAAGAVAAVNGGFFVTTTTGGIPGDPAGIQVEQGRLISEATNGRVAMQLGDNGKNIHIGRLSTTMTMSITPAPNAAPGDAAVERRPVERRIDGINRSPDKIRNCGGDADDQPTALPLHDMTCTDENELVLFTSEFGAATPAGSGTQATIDQHGIVTQVGGRDGAAVPSGGQILQAIGTEATWLADQVKVGDKLSIRTAVLDATGKNVNFDRHDSVINGGPQLISSGQVEIRPRADGLIHDDAGFFWNWGVRRNPRTMAGTTDDGRILLVTADGRQAGSNVGLTLNEGARLMKSLGAVSAMNLDGGGSSVMVVNGQVVNCPSDGSERSVSNALVLIPR